VWEFLRPFVYRYDASLFSSPEFARKLPIPQYLFYPCIDPLSDKNIDLDAEYVRGVVKRFGIDPERPIVTQISRFDRLKDPIGVVRAYQIVKRYLDCQLVLAGGSAPDDPEGEIVLEEVRREAEGDPDIHLLNLPPWSAKEINPEFRS
jgi:trehalose synthase